VIFAVYAKRLLPEFGISLKFGREILQTVLKYSSGIIGYQVLSNLLLLFERGWVTRKLGAESLTYYVVPMSLSLYIHGFVSSLLLVVFPLASEMKNDTEKLLRLYTKATKIICMTVVFLATSLIVESYYFLSLWLGKEFADNSSDLLVLHTITFSLAAILAVSWQMTEGLGYTNYNFSVFSICLVVSVILMIALTPDYGNYGVAFGRLAGFAVIFFSIFKIEKRVFQKIQTRFWMYLIGKLVVAAFFCAIVEKILITNLALNWFTLITATAAGGIVYCVLLFLLNFISVEERQLVNRLFSK
jgi:O-antigen/teichoic acid export membrane protein